MLDDNELKALQKQAVESMQLAQGKIEFLAQHGNINPFAIIQDRVEWLVEWLIPSHVDRSHMGSLPTSEERLRFDIWCNEKTIAKCDEAMGQTGSGLHVVKGSVDDN